jgi:hypothetical protein
LVRRRDKLVLDINEKNDASCKQAFDHNKPDEKFITEESACGTQTVKNFNFFYLMIN